MIVRLLKSKNDLVSEGASEAVLHIVTPPEEDSAAQQYQEQQQQQQPNHAAVRAAGAIPTLLNLVALLGSLNCVKCVFLKGNTCTSIVCHSGYLFSCMEISGRKLMR